MTQEDKELLLKDLCARLPYGVVVKDRNATHKLTVGNTEFTDLFYSNKCNIKPYLRPMPSMTEEEKNYIGHKWGADNFGDIITYSYCEGGVSEIELADIIGFQDWLNAHHFDFRNLIERGLAIDCTGLNIY